MHIRTPKHEASTIEHQSPNKKPEDAEISELRQLKQLWEERRFKDMLNESEQKVSDAEDQTAELPPQKLDSPVKSPVFGSKPLPIQRSFSSAKIVRGLQTPANSPDHHAANIEELADKLQKLASGFMEMSECDDNTKDDECIFRMDIEGKDSNEDAEQAQASKSMRLG